MAGKILNIILGLIVLIAVAHTLALKFYLYYELWWFDLLMHFAGGFWTILFFLWLLFFSNLFLMDLERKNFLLTSILSLSFLLLVTIGWEMFELNFGLTFLEDPDYWRDTISDVSMALMGGALSLRFFFPEGFHKIQK